MPTPVPTVPSPLPAVEVAAAPRAGTPVVALGRRAGDQPSFGDPGLTPQWADALGLTGKAGEVASAPPGAAASWVVGVGAGAAADWGAAGAALARAAQDRLTEGDPRPSLQLDVPDDTPDDALAAFLRGVLLGGYRFTVTGAQQPPRLRGLRLVVSDPDRRERIGGLAERTAVLAAATAFARDLANAPANVKDPAWLARTIARAAAKVSGVDAVVRDEAWLAERGFGGVLAVGGGSARPPRLVELTYAPAGAGGPHLVLVGKGITFDTGGISVKPAEGMHLMRTDMAGGAAVAAATIAIARLGLPVRITALVPCAENHISGSAYRPGDVVRHYGGQTTEVTNTDAEGRMVMADALAYAHRDLGADLLVDVATLTGAMKISLGLRTGGLFATDDDLAARIAAAGSAVGESWWRMPLLADHAEDVVSTIADLRQCPPGPGGITAALFLREFTGGLPWAHLDIAGPARAEKTYGEVVPGATGFGARTLVELAESFAG